MYGGGKGIPEDQVEAVKWYRKAAEKGLADAQDTLGLKYATGSGVPLDFVQAYAWLNIAAAQGKKGSEEAKRLVDESMTREERTRAQEFSREYWETYVLPFRD